jgi:Asfivirus cysteine protease S273R
MPKNRKPTKKYSHPNACSFGRTNTFNDGKTCFTKTAIKDIARAWNMSGGDPKISNINNKSKQILYKDLKSRMTECDTEWCWIKHPKIAKLLKKNKEVQFSFGPAIPPGKYEWLRTTDIDLVGKQIEYFYPHFYYMGAVPIDFRKIYRSQFDTHFNVRDYLADKITQLGIIFNTDPSTKTGKHWIALFVDLKKKYAYYFDSVGNSAPQQVKNWVRDKLPGFKFKENKTQHQFENSECGIYALHFLDKMASGVSFSKVEKRIVKDEEMNGKRIEYFNGFTPRKK